MAALGADFHRILQHRHHPEAEQVDFHDAQVLAIVLVPLQDDPPRHARVFQWHNLIEAAGAQDHPSRMLSEMSREAEHSPAE
jgi:hypothetical protein